MSLSSFPLLYGALTGGWLPRYPSFFLARIACLPLGPLRVLRSNLSLEGSAASTHLETGGFVRSDPGVAHPNIQFHFLPSQVIDHGRQAPHLEAYQVHVGPMRASSVGWMKLTSSDPRAAPLLQPNYLSTEQDR